MTDQHRLRLADLISRTVYKAAAELRDPSDVLLAVAHGFDGDRCAWVDGEGRLEEYKEVVEFINAKIWGVEYGK